MSARSARPSPSRGLFALKLAVMCASLLIVVLLLEIALQFVVPLVFRTRYTRIDDELGWHHNADVSRVNVTEGYEYVLSYDADGYRPRYPVSADGRRRTRLVVVGDSFVDAAEVGDEETFSWLLDACLPEVEVINLGVYGYSTAQELLLLTREIDRLEPDLVLLLTISNDYIGNTMALESFGPAPRFLLDGDGLAFESTDHPEARVAFLRTNIPAPRWIHRNSLLYYVLNHYVFQRLAADRIEAVRQERAARHGEAERRELYHRLVQRMRDGVNAAGARFAVTHGYLRGELDADRSPNEAIRARLAESHIESFDLHRALREAEAEARRSGQSLYYEHDIHWNARGNAVVADLLAPVIEAWMAGRPLPDQATSRGRCGS